MLEAVPLVEFMYLVFTRMPGESYRRRLWSLFLCLCYVFRAVINSFVFFSSVHFSPQAFAGWGDYLRKVYQRTDDYVRKDLTINYLGYWTDNGE